MKVEIELAPDVVARLPLTRLRPDTPEEYAAYARGEHLPLSLEEFVNEAIRKRPTLAEARGLHYRKMVHSGAVMGDPEYKALWREINE